MLPDVAVANNSSQRHGIELVAIDKSKRKPLIGWFAN